VECWDINRPEIIAITYLSFSPSTTQSDVAIRIAKAAAPPATLQNAYQYLEIISSVPDSEIPNATLRFSLNRSWLNVTGVNKSEITLFRYTITSGATASNWNKLPTSIFGETPQYVTYQTLSPGLSFFAVAAPPPQCPVCPQPTEWATCQQQADASGLQTRTSYSCSAQTDYQCVSGQESRQCCPECPQPGEFGACTAGRQSRAVYACGDATGFKCTEQTENRNCVSQAEAQSAIAAAQTAITEASQQNKNVTQAQSLLLQAQGAFSAADYSQSKSLADQARNAALTAPVLVFPSPIPIIAPIVVTIIALAILLVLWRAKKIPWPRVTRPSAAQLCYIGREETVLGLRCSVCNRVVCTRHARSIAGRIYCAYHSPYGPRPPGPPGAPPPRAAPRPPVAPRR
jgi:PGF-pre-PGF domain-containing protein